MERHGRSSATKRKTKAGYRKNQSLTTLEDCAILTSLIHMTWSSKKPFNMRGESWKFRCQQQCLARFGKESTRKLVALLMLPRQNTHASLKPTNLRESFWKELYMMWSAQKPFNMLCDLEGYRWDAVLLNETWRPAKSEIWETHHKHKKWVQEKNDNKHGVGILLTRSTIKLSTLVPIPSVFSPISPTARAGDRKSGPINEGFVFCQQRQREPFL